MTRRRVLIYVQHLLGIGHLKRAATLARAFLGEDMAVTLVSGGHPVAGLAVGDADFVQLPPVRAADLYFKQLVDENERPIDEAWRATRRNLLGETWRRVRPHVVVFELFPFGRRQMRFELIPLLDEATASPRRPIIVCSVRDILVGQTKPGRHDEMLELVETYFDHILVHGDPEFVPLGETFPHAERLAGKLHYTGYVVDRSGRRGGPHSPGHGEVIVSAGGGAVGERLLRAAMDARAHTRLKHAAWRVLVGASVAEPAFCSLAGTAPEGVVVERARADFTTLVANCVLSISQGGYNSVMEVLHAGTRGVIVPYAGGIETEQTLRAKRLAGRGGIHVVAEESLSPAALARAVEAAMDAPPGSLAGIATSGAEVSAGLVRDWAHSVTW